MNNIEILKKKLLVLQEEINADPACSTIKFNQQRVSTENMSFSGCNGRLWIQPFHEKFDVSLSGQSLEKELTPVFNKLFNKGHDGYKQTDGQPYWRTDDFALVKAATEKYAKTRK